MEEELKTRSAKFLVGVMLYPTVSSFLELYLEEPHIELPDYSNKIESIMSVTSGFVETTVIKGFVIPALIP